jgi:hypothetical protein
MSKVKELKDYVDSIYKANWVAETGTLSNLCKMILALPDESPKTEQGIEAVELLRWIHENNYTTVKFKGETRWCTMEVADYGSSRDDAYMTEQELVNLYKSV